MSSFKINKIATFFSTSFGIGYISRFPGTLASFIILIPIWFLKKNFTIDIVILILIFFTFFSLIIIHLALTELKCKDPSFIILDEYIGQAFSLIFCEEQILQYFVAFILFRFFDIVKPFPISYFDNLNNSFGVVFDDVIAGIFSGILTFLIFKWII